VTRKPPEPRYKPVLGFKSMTEAIMHFEAEGKKPGEIAAIVGSTTEAVRGSIQRRRMQRRNRESNRLSDRKHKKASDSYRAFIAMLAEALSVEPMVLHALCRNVRFSKPAPVSPHAAAEVDGGTEPVETPSIDPPDTPSAGPPFEADELNPEPDDDENGDDSGVLGAEGWVPATQAPPEPVSPPTAQPGSKDEAPELMTTLPLKKFAIDEVGTALVTLRGHDGQWLHLSGQALTRDKAYRYRGRPDQARRMRLTNPLARGMRIEPHTERKQ